MSIQLHEEAQGKILEVHLSGKLTKDDYLHFGPEVERLMGQHRKLRLLVHLQDFHGWTAGALWQDLKFDFKHFRHLERVALVGDRAWEHGMAIVCKPFTTAKIRYFDVNKMNEAREWIEADLPNPAECCAAAPAQMPEAQAASPLHQSSTIPHA